MEYQKVPVLRLIKCPVWLLIVCFLGTMQSDLALAMVAGSQCFPGLFIFGDSLADSGNAIEVYPDRFNRTEAAPFGVAWPGYGAARFSDGPLLGDFSAWAIGHSPSGAYLRSDQNSLQSGANFAAAGSTVLDDYPTNSLSDPNFLLARTPFNMETQVQWWLRFRRNVTSSMNSGSERTAADSVNKFLHLVFMGATDYLLQHSSSFSEHKILASVPHIVNRIAKNLETLHEHGAQSILVVNLPPLGCTPAFLSMFPGQADEYDSFGCLKKINTAILRHNQLLFRAVSRLQKRYRSVSSFVYADLYQSTQAILNDPQHYGFEKSTILKACCGAGGAYNFSPNLTCGGHNVTACENPSRHLTWDGYHFSQSVVRIAALDFFQGKHVHPSNGLLPNNCRANFTLFWANVSPFEHSLP